MADQIPNLSEKEFIIMNLLVGSRPKYGLELIEKSDGALKRGTIYTTLNRLEEKGYIESKQDEPRPGYQPRRQYKATGLGEKVYRAIGSVGGRAWLKGALA